MRIFLILLVLAVNTISFGFAQSKGREWGVGVAGIYNFQTEGWGGEVRGDYRLNRHFALVPEVSYFPSFNKIEELYAGISGHYLFKMTRNIDGYFTAGGFYNNWFNAAEYSNGAKKQDNVTAEGGGGLVRSRGCIRPFIESRWNAKWQEATIRVGILWFPKACKKPDCAAFN